MRALHTDKEKKKEDNKNNYYFVGSRDNGVLSVMLNITAFGEVQVQRHIRFLVPAAVSKKLGRINPFY